MSKITKLLGLRMLKKIILISASFVALNCHSQEVFLECKLNKWINRAFSSFEPILILRRLKFDQVFLVKLDLKKKTASVTYENYEIYLADSETYILKGEIDAFRFDREVGEVYWIVLNEDRSDGIPVASGSCDARTNKKKF